MQKKLIALAIAGLAAAPVLAQSSNVTIYGRANLGLDNYTATGSVAGGAADFKSRNRVYDNGSRLGFKGTEDMGNGLKANFVIESGINMDTGSNNGQSGLQNVSTGFFATRQSYLGLQGGFGEVRAGRQEVYWTGGRINDVSANELGVSFSIPTGGSGMIANPGGRTSNVLMYVSPEFSGVQLAAGYVAGGPPGSFNNSGGETATAGTDTNGKGWAVQANYNNGPIAVKWDYVKTTTNDLVNTGSPAGGVPNASGNKLLLGYFYSGLSHVGLAVMRETNGHKAASGTIIGSGDNLAQNSWEINWEHYFGNFQTIVAYGQARAVSGLTGTTADAGQTKYKEWGLAGLYHFSKRTHAYVNYAQLTNGQQNWADLNGGSSMSSASNPVTGTSGLGSGSRGADPRVFGIGMMHNF